MQLPNESFAVDGKSAAQPAADGAYANPVSLVIPKGCVALVALYGEAKVNPAGTAEDRLINSLEWAATFDETQGGSGATAKPFELNPAPGAAGHLLWTYSDGHPLHKLILRRVGTFSFGPWRNGAALPGTVQGALARLRGFFLPDTTPPEELVRLLALWTP